MPKNALCKDCINFINADVNGLITCDYEYWENEPFYQAILNTPEMYNCIHYEYDPEFVLGDKTDN